MSWKSVHDFETLVSSWFGAKYGIAVDSCTHGVELCLRYKKVKKLSIPKRTYLSIPSLSPCQTMQLSQFSHLIPIFLVYLVGAY